MLGLEITNGWAQLLMLLRCHLVGCPVDQGVTYVYHSGVRIPEKECKLSSAIEVNTKDPAVWSTSGNTWSENENSARPPPTHWDLRMYLKEKGDNMRDWEEKPFTDLALWAHERGESLFKPFPSASPASGPHTALTTDLNLLCRGVLPWSGNGWS